jgi:hypothetical protein
MRTKRVTLKEFKEVVKSLLREEISKRKAIAESKDKVRNNRLNEANYTHVVVSDGSDHWIEKGSYKPEKGEKIVCRGNKEKCENFIEDKEEKKAPAKKKMSESTARSQMKKKSIL